MEDYVAPITEAAFEAPTIEPLTDMVNVEDMTAEANSEFGWKQGLVIGGMAIGGACVLYTLWDVVIAPDSVVRTKTIPWFKGLFSKGAKPVQPDDGLVDDVNEAIVDEDE